MANHNIFKFSQSKKWLKELAPPHRAPMCEVKGDHFYLFEPVELSSGLIIIPIYFYSQDSQLYSKCIAPEFEPFTKNKKNLMKMKIPQDIKFNHPKLLVVPTSEFNKCYKSIEINGIKISQACANSIYDDGQNNQTKLNFPNPWRKTADGRIIRHVPITLYCDDTSGNVSKKFNKHISFYFTLAGLPPKLSNQEYNCHFLSTSNRASALELLAPIVGEMNEIKKDGFVAFDSHIMQEVLVTGLVFSFLGDSPMHAEITNTPNPGSSLNPCRMCTLHAKGKDQRKTLDYVQQFLRINPDGSEARNERTWRLTQERTYELYCSAIEKSHAEFIRKKREWGLTDSLNNRFLEESKNNVRIRELMENLEENQPERLFNSILALEGFDGVKDTPVEVLHVALLGFVKYLARDVLSGKNMKPNQKSELAARLQSFNTLGLNIPPINGKSFVTHIKKIWTALCQLVPFIFVTKINNMDEYQKHLKAYIRNFIYHAIKTTAQWVNKPKFHHLLHLPESILRFGPATLFSTEKFESFNGVLQNASIHSNRQSPGRDIAITFDNYYVLRFLLSGGYMYDHSTQTYSTAAQEVLQIFQNNDFIRKSLGYNFSTANPLPPQQYPFAKNTKVPKEDLLEVHQVQIKQHEMLQRGCFIVIPQHGSKLLVGSVESLWEQYSTARSKFYIHFNHFKLMGINELYSMREICRTKTKQYFNVRDVQACINVQHNCKRGNCPIKNTQPAQIERQETEIKTAQVEHTDNRHFVINTASFHDPFQHHQISQTDLPQISNQDMVQCVLDGLENWGLHHFEFEKNNVGGEDENDVDDPI
ncbi:hypothetical protein PTTG_28931 [Puccinia triticina 1-1 BBBD Race 1]|uniref:Uncharacterized protein n=1 Tax=Puccinia triticina (isolate 1-1 / race 1 (BBBD)) TaxID=630390 RepID=A0A180G7T0_PUCT1|nr:hypothetical protein PTTG_28931 [Puccinia triticina 1-1 BBBD Race 1]